MAHNQYLSSKHKMHACLSLAALLTMLTAACNRDIYYDQSRNVDEQGWDMSDSVELDLQIDDTAQYYTIYFDLRNSISYSYANSFFFITTTFPDNSQARDTLECPMADPTGKWYGKTSGRYVDNRYVFKRAVRFPMEGTYHFDITHGMRDAKIAGIKDVGLRLQKIQLKSSATQSDNGSGAAASN